MKKAPLFLFLLSMILLCCCVCFFILRNMRSGMIRISGLPSMTTTAFVIPQETTSPTLPMPESVNINTASLEQLMTLPGIGNVYAQRIIEYRETHGPFTDISELLNVHGIGQNRLDAIAEFITIGGTHENTGS